MNILVFGHAGVERRKASAALVAGLAADVGRTGAFQRAKDADVVPSTILEDELGDDLIAFLDIDDRRNQQRLWNEAASKAIARLVSSDVAVHRVLVLHASFLRQSQIWSCLNPLIFRELGFRPDVAVTLIDDVQNVQHRLGFKRGGHDWLRLRELVTWRNVEISNGDLFLRSCAIDAPRKNFVLGIRHPVKTVVELLTRPDLPAIYSGHPISHIRRLPHAEQKMAISEIEQFKEHLRSVGPVLDPATIDELALVRLRESATDSALITYRQSMHWPVSSAGTLSDSAEFPSDIVLDRLEVEEASSDVRRLVHFRDYRLMDQSDCLISYRPNWAGEDHGGVTAEFRFAKMTAMPRLAWGHSSDPRLGEVFQYVTAEAESLEDVRKFLAARVKVGRRFLSVN